MTIDEAIKHCLEEAGELQKRADSAELIDILDGLDVEACKECAADHRQLAEWLMDYKDLKAEQNDQYVFIHELMSELREAKQLLKSAVEDFNEIKSYLSEPYSHLCDKWRYENEALKLLNDEKINNVK